MRWSIIVRTKSIKGKSFVFDIEQLIWLKLAVQGNKSNSVESNKMPISVINQNIKESSNYIWHTSTCRVFYSIHDMTIKNVNLKQSN